MSNHFSLLALATVLVLTGFGCTNPIDAAKDKVTDTINQKVGEKVGEAILEKSTGGQVDLDDNTITYKDEKTGDQTAYGESLTIPPEFPIEVQTLDKASVTSYTGKGDGSQFVSIQSLNNVTITDTAKMLEDKYLSLGYKRSSDAAVNGSIVRNYKKDKKTVTILVMGEGESTSQKVTVTLTVIEEK